MLFPINVILVDDNINIRSGLKLLLSDNPDYSLNDAGFSEVFKHIKNELTIAIIRLEQREYSKIMTIISDIHKDYPAVSILILAYSSEDPQVLMALKAGARGCLLKDSTFDDLKRAIQELAEGNVFIPSIISTKLIQKLSGPYDWEKNDNSLTLSTQQLRVLKLISLGYSSEEIAKALFISKRTVDMHTYKLFRRLNVSSRTQAIQVAMRSGLIDNFEEIETT